MIDLEDQLQGPEPDYPLMFFWALYLAAMVVAFYLLFLH